MLALLLPAIPFGSFLAIAFMRPNRYTSWLALVSALGISAGGIVAAVRVLEQGPIEARWEEFVDIRIDALSALMVLFIGVIAAVTATTTIGTLRSELDAGVTNVARVRRYDLFLNLALAAAVTAVIVNNLGVMWIAIETGTLATVLLVGHRRDLNSMEAAWKYVVLSSVGISTALLGTGLVYFTSAHSGWSGATLEWNTLFEHATSLDHRSLRVAIGLVVVGYGTKAALAPVHSWAPDTYSQAPAPIAGFLSVIMASIPMYAILRFKAIADITLGPGFVRRLLVPAALLSLFAAASIVITQRDYKRLLAYSSVEHAGLLALAAAVGTELAVTALLLHMVGSGLAKCVAFNAAGEIKAATGTSKIAGVSGLLTRAPFIGAVFGLAVAALAGFPPFSVLASELGIIRAGLDAGLGWVVGIAVVLMLAIFSGFAVHVIAMLSGEPSEPQLDAEPSFDPSPELDAELTSARRRRIDTYTTSMFIRVPTIAALTMCAVLGISMWPIQSLLRAGAKVLVP